MKKIIQKAAAILTASLMTVSALGAGAYAESAKILSQDTYEISYEASLSKPKYSIKGSKGVRYVKLTASKSGATIYYTTNGKKPTTNSKKYKTGALLKFKKTTKLKAIAVYGSRKSAVMTKTIQVPTLYGDVIGDGNITEADYTRLRKYLTGNTSFICKDNADCDGNGKINSDDLSILSRYLDDEIPSLPYKTPTVTKPAKPVISESDAVGGKQVEIRSSESGAVIYYTLNGSNPTTSSTRYTGKFLVTTAGTKTIKAIVYKNNTTSDIQQYNLYVPSVEKVDASMPTTSAYTDPITVKLTCLTPGSTIYYTTDSTDPKTSRTSVKYYNPLTVDKTTTIKVYASAKGYADSNITTFSYRFNASTVTLSGNVWDDTPYVYTTPDGVKSAGETGIMGIKVHALNTKTNRLVMDTTTDAYGNYTLKDLPAGTYKVVFDINTQKYRPYTSLISNGNQALLDKQVQPMSVKATGAYNDSNTLLTNITSYANAQTNTYFNSTATTYYEYSKTTSDIGLALNTNVYGELSLSATVTGQSKEATAGLYTVKIGDKLTYTITLTNNSPTTYLSDVNIGFYITDSLSDIVVLSNGYPVTFTIDGIKSGYKTYTMKNLIAGTGIAPGRSVSFTVTGTVSAAEKSQINCSAEVTSYKFYNAVYDRTSVPGNMTIGVKRENDETVAQTIIAAAAQQASNAKIHVDTNSVSIAQGQTATFDVVIENVSNMSEFEVKPTIPNNLVGWSFTPVQQGNNYKLTFIVTANTEGILGTAYIDIKIVADPTINATIAINVTS